MSASAVDDLRARPLGSLRVSVGPGQSRSLFFELSSAAARRLVRNDLLTAQLDVVARAPGGRSVADQLDFEITRPGFPA